MKTHKRKKSSRSHGRKMGTSGHGSRKQHRSTGNRGGRGMAGTGKRADHKKTLILNLYGSNYFGKQGVTSRRTQKDKRDRINLKQISENLQGFGKKTSKGWEINLENYKILGDGEIKEKLIIKAKEASSLAIKKIEKLGGKILLSEKESEDKTE
jgi:large subunit ribosomal protein L15